MAAKKSENDGILFLYTCFKNAQKNGGKVDIASVAAAHGINGPAAQMRLTRLRKHLDTLIEQEAAVGPMSPKAPETPKTPKSEGVRGASIKKENDKGSEAGAMTPTPTPAMAKKTKKRKVAEMEDAGVERDNTNKIMTVAVKTKAEE